MVNKSKGTKREPAPRKKNGGDAWKTAKDKEPTVEITEDETFLEGVAASSKGVGKHRNPYPHDSEAYEWWRRGWEAQYYGET